LSVNKSIIITQKDAKKYITVKEIIDLEVQTYKWYSEKKIVMPAKITLNMDRLGLPNWINSMPSYIKPLEVLGIKWAGGFQGNKEHGLPYIMAQILINNPKTGELKALVDGNWITDIRTGAQSAVAAKYLANKTDVITIIGAGIQGLNTAICMLEEFDIKEINIYDISNIVCDKFVKEIIKYHL
jgi:alanine dehydrogenase